MLSILILGNPPGICGSYWISGRISNLKNPAVLQNIEFAVMKCFTNTWGSDNKFITTNLMRTVWCVKTLTLHFAFGS